jgi:hypothetical protein
MAKQQEFLRVTVNGSTQLAHYPVDTAGGKIHQHRRGCPDLFQHQVTLDRLGLKEMPDR